MRHLLLFLLLFASACRGKLPLPTPTRILVLPLLEGPANGVLPDYEWTTRELPFWVAHILAGSPGIELVQANAARALDVDHPVLASELAKQSGADAVLTGQIEPLGSAGAKVRMRLLASDGRLLGYATAQTSSPARALDLFSGTRRDLVRLLHLSAATPEVGTEHLVAFRSYIRALACIGREAPIDARAELERSLELAPKFAPAQVALGHVLLDLGLGREAHQSHFAATALLKVLTPADRASFDLLGARLVDDGDEIDRTARAQLALRPSDAHALLLGARTAVALRFDVEAGKSGLGRLVKAYPHLRTARIELANLLLFSGDAAGARAAMAGASALRPEQDAAFLDAKALVFAGANELAAAEEAYIAANDVGYRASHAGRAWLALFHGNAEKAEAHLRELEGPIRESTTALVAAARGQCGRAAEAAARFEKMLATGEAQRVARDQVLARVLRARVAFACENWPEVTSLLKDVVSPRVVATKAQFHGATLFGLAALFAGDAQGLRTARSWLEEAMTKRGAKLAPLVALLEGEESLRKGDAAAALKHAEKAILFRSELSLALLLRARGAGGSADCASGEIVADTQFPGQLGGMENLPHRWQIESECFIRQKRPKEALALQKRISQLREGSGPRSGAAQPSP